MSKNYILKAVNVKKVYKQFLEDDVKVLKGIDLSILKGEFIAIVGPSGAGKSTLLHILGGLDVPTEGDVLFDNNDLYMLKDEELADVRNTKIGFVFQFYHLLPEFTALENVLLPAIIKDKQNKKSKNYKKSEYKAYDLLGQFGLKNRINHKPSQLSGGEQQRVSIARALINEPKIIFCDEPTGNLDSDSSKEIIRILIDLNKANDQTVVIVTHDQSIADEAGSVLKMKDGLLE